jgi:hypothetical protein
LSDVNTTGSSAGDLLRYDGTGWEKGEPLFIDVTAPPYNVTAGAANSTAGMQAAVDDAEAAGGRALLLPAGTINCNIEVGSNIALRGQGILATTLKSVAGSDADVIKGKSFDDNTNGGWTGNPEDNGDNFLELSDLTIDGNKADNSSGYGIRIWGRAHRWTNMVVRNCADDGIWSEFAREVTSFAGDTPLLEGNFHGITTIWNNGNGWTFRGPHDSMIDKFVTFGNSGWGLE